MIFEDSFATIIVRRQKIIIENNVFLSNFMSQYTKCQETKKGVGDEVSLPQLRLPTPSSKEKYEPLVIHGCNWPDTSQSVIVSLQKPNMMGYDWSRRNCKHQSAAGCYEN